MCFERLKSTVGRKAVMAVSGLILLLFVAGHMIGNLQVFLGQEALNSYADHLQSLPVLLWPVRLFLLLVLLLHMAVSISLAWENKTARPVPYAYQDTVQAGYVSRTMVVSGVVIFTFIVYHLLHFTFGTTHPQYFQLTDSKGRHDVYSMVILSFRDLWVSGSYVAAMAVLCAHLSHGIQSLFQSLGFNNEKSRPFFEKLAIAASIMIFIGNSFIPFAVLMGFLKLPSGVI